MSPTALGVGVAGGCERAAFGARARRRGGVDGAAGCSDSAGAAVDALRFRDVFAVAGGGGMTFVCSSALSAKALSLADLRDAIEEEVLVDCCRILVGWCEWPMLRNSGCVVLRTS